ncbi:Membrane protein FAM174B [Plecturocebus cupreus]
MTPCNVLVVAAAVARALPGAAASCQAPRSRLRRRIPRCRPRAGTDPGIQPRAPCPALRCPHRTMRALPPPAPLLPLLLLALLVAPAARASKAESVSASQPEPERASRPPPGPSPGNATRTGSGAAGAGGSSNSSGNALVTRISTLLRDLPTLKAAVIVAFALTTLLIACLLLRVFRWALPPCSFPRRPTGRHRRPAAPRARPTCTHRCPGPAARLLPARDDEKTKAQVVW